jgi:chromosome partitioning protein
MGKVVLVGGEKGGTGKSTIATNLAALRVQGGGDVLLVDADRQASTANWSYFRRRAGLGGIECIQLFGKAIKSEMDSKRKRFEHIIIDAGGHDSPHLRYAMMAADIMIIPFGASQHDLSTATTMEELIGKARMYNEELTCFGVINRMRNHSRLKDGGQAIDYLKDFKNFDTLDFIIHERISFSRTAQAGRGVNEMLTGSGAKDEQAITEIRNLHDYIYGF